MVAVTSEDSAGRRQQPSLISLEFHHNARCSNPPALFAVSGNDENPPIPSLYRRRSIRMYLLLKWDFSIASNLHFKCYCFSCIYTCMYIYLNRLCRFWNFSSSLVYVELSIALVYLRILNSNSLPFNFYTYTILIRFLYSYQWI